MSEDENGRTAADREYDEIEREQEAIEMAFEAALAAEGVL